MPELAEILRSTVAGQFEAIDRAEAERLRRLVEATRKLESGADPLNVIEEMAAIGAVPSFYAAERGRVEANLAMQTYRERTSTTGGGVQFGPVRVNASYATGLRQGTTTNLVVVLEFERLAVDGLTPFVDLLISRIGSLVAGPLPGAQPPPPQTPSRG